MKFLVITSGNELESRAVRSEKELAEMVQEASRLYDEKIIESSFVFTSGGAAFVLNADSTTQLSVLIQSNVLFKHRYHEIIPIADAVDFLERFAELIGKTEKNG